MLRSEIIHQIKSTPAWDVLVIGGGATGLGTALDAALRGYKTLLVEAHDFAKGTSSRSTKLVHGGVRYLRQGNVSLVLDGLRERGRMLRNAPHLAHRRAFIIPAYSVWEVPFYGIGLTLYDLLARRERLGRSRILSRDQTIAALPGIQTKGLKGGILYIDGQFDDARFAIALLRSIQDAGGLAINYARVVDLHKNDGRVDGATVQDTETGDSFELHAKITINATGIFADEIRRMDDPAVRKTITASQGSHVVLRRSFLPGESALMVPRTADGRVLFAIPWHEHVVVGTTDEPVPQAEIEPRSMEDERRFLLDHIERYLGKRPDAEDILSVWSGQRPLVSHGETNTSTISRDHTILVSEAKLVTIVGGKWTTYRKMAEDVVDQAAKVANLSQVPSRSAELALHGSKASVTRAQTWSDVYGADLAALERVIAESNDLQLPLHPNLPFRRGEVVWAVRHEMARTVEDVLARRTRALFLDARASLACSTLVASLMAQELVQTEAWQAAQIASFRSVAQAYIW